MSLAGLEAVLAEFLPWARETFPASTAVSCFNHLKREVAELEADVCEPGEIADCVFLLVDLCQRGEIDLVQALRDKFQAVQGRTWGPIDSEGVVEHVRE